jgi:multisubunit Na+/H+ antiporter MnhC subunit
MRRNLTVLSILLVCALVCGVATAYSATIKVNEQSVETRTVKLNEGDLVFMHLTVIPSGVNFSILTPASQAILNSTNLAETDLQFSASAAGDYLLQFENWTPETKFVTLNYNVQHYIFGFPQEFVLLFIVIGLALVAVIAFVAMSPRV